MFVAPARHASAKHATCSSSSNANTHTHTYRQHTQSEKNAVSLCWSVTCGRSLRIFNDYIYALLVLLVLLRARRADQTTSARVANARLTHFVAPPLPPVRPQSFTPICTRRSERACLRVCCVYAFAAVAATSQRAANDINTPLAAVAPPRHHRHNDERSQTNVHHTPAIKSINETGSRRGHHAARAVRVRRRRCS